MDQNIGLVCSQVVNFNQTLTTNKAYFLIDGLIFVIGNVDKTSYANNDSNNPLFKANEQNKSMLVYTTIINDMSETTITKEELSTTNLGNISRYESSTNGYYILDSYSGSNVVNKHVSRTVNPYVINTNRKSESKITRQFNEVYIDHSTATGEKSKQFVYAIVPNDTDKQSTLNKLNNIKIVNDGKNDDGFCIEYSDEQYTYSLMTSFKENISFNTNGANITFNSPCSSILKKSKSSGQYSMINSSNISSDNISITFDKVISELDTRKIGNIHEVGILDNTKLEINNKLYYKNDTNHNTWCTFYLN